MFASERIHRIVSGGFGGGRRNVGSNEILIAAPAFNGILCIDSQWRYEMPLWMQIKFESTTDVQYLPAKVIICTYRSG